MRIIWDGTEKEKIINKISLYNLRNYIELKGRITDVSIAYKKSLALIQPSYFESFGMTVIEAMAHSRPVIATKSGGPEGIVQDGNTGFLTEIGDAEELAEKMAFLLDNKMLAEQMGQEGRKLYEQKFTRHVAREKFVSIIEDTLTNFKEYTNSKLLVYDLLNFIHDKNYVYKYIEETACAERDEVKEKISQNLNENIIHTNNKRIDLSKLKPSRRIYRSKKYIIESNKDAFNTISIIIGTHFQKPNGILRLLIKSVNHKDYVLREAEINLNDVSDNSKVSFVFEEVNKALGHRFILEFVPIYEKNSSKISIYEYRDKGTKAFKNKFVNLKNNLYFELI
ncbi:glycosyltransferase [Caloranaerobacter azorensis]|uniref:Glycosyltransferase family 4 protein n=1 Tax=Caloranaerobacter azorensis TaxID=116090 RepID=A0A6P1YFT3_9FIRM|nr:glycosyltransferase family 4 protein [Caloranaerobacter azorensis]